MAGFAPWQPATKCSGEAAPGARALMAVILARWPAASSAGIYSCRSVRGGGSRSIHSEGRALDVHFPGKTNPAGTLLVAALLPVADRLGIQAVIWSRRIWSAKSPTGRHYGGVNPHYDHVHIELTRTSGAKLTKATVVSVLTSASPPTATPVDLDAAIRRAKRDGTYGGRIAAALKAEGLRPDLVGYATWQRRLGYKGNDADGIAGRKSLTELGRQHGWKVE